MDMPRQWKRQVRLLTSPPIDLTITLTYFVIVQHYFNSAFPGESYFKFQLQIDEAVRKIWQTDQNILALIFAEVLNFVASLTDLKPEDFAYWVLAPDAIVVFTRKQVRYVKGAIPGG